MKNSLVSVFCLVLAAAASASAQEPQWQLPAQSVVPPAQPAPSSKPAPPPQPPSSSDVNVRSAYLLGSDDVVHVRVADAPEIGTQPVRIDPAGDIRLPMVGTIHAAGLSIEKLESELRERLKVYIQTPDLSVSVTEFHSQPVSVIGAVQQTGVQQMQGAKTLIEVLSLAGGLAPDAGPTVRVTRRHEWGPIPLAEATEDVSSGFFIADINVKGLLSGSAPEKNIMVRPHDVITVGRASVVFVIGEVGRPGSVPLTTGSVTAIEAVANAGGMLRTALATSARILRENAGGGPRTEIALNLKSMMQGQTPDVPLMAGDILVVPDNPGRRALARAVELAVQTGLAVGTYNLIR